MTALLVGTALALVALAFVLHPIFRQRGSDHRPRAPRAQRDAERAADELDDLEFDRASGRLSDDEYRALRAETTVEAAQVIASAEAAAAEGSATTGDEVEAFIARFRAAVVTCPTCGERPEPAAVFCSSCGKRLG